MEFALSEEQRLFADSLRSLLADRVPVEALRRHAENGSGFDAGLWDSLVELGLPGLLVPERFGGAGLGIVDAAVAAEVLGGAAAFAPFVGSVVMATLAFTHGATEELQDAWLPRIAAGEVRFGVGTGAALHGDRLTGEVKAAIDAGAPTHLLLYLADGSAAVVAADAPGVAAKMHRSIDRTRPVTDLAFDNAEAVVLDAANAPMQAMQRVLDAGRVVLAADTLGAAQHMFDQALGFVKQRTQFNRVIGSFQAVKHQFADMVTMLEP
ncbi:MAG TPA: acyl-CoA dehydrogenase family protein, partial [Acetobacteraceae bacterium]|nr:acyl-CoA dehydrogenase family protein [Acetobacteraceae bacterium]